LNVPGVVDYNLQAMKRFSFFIALTLGLTTGCGLLNNKEKSEDKAKKQAEEVFKAWVDAHNNHSLSALDTLYAEEVFYYSKNFSKRDLLTDKAKALKPGSDFRMEVIDPKWEVKEDEATVNYEKYAYWRGKEVHVVSELALEKQGKSWRITREVDLDVKSVNYEITKDEAWELVESFVTSQGYQDMHSVNGLGDMKGPVEKDDVLCWKATSNYTYSYNFLGGAVGFSGQYEIYVSVKDGRIVSSKFSELK